MGGVKWHQPIEMLLFDHKRAFDWLKLAITYVCFLPLERLAFLSRYASSNLDLMLIEVLMAAAFCSTTALETASLLRDRVLVSIFVTKVIYLL